MKGEKNMWLSTALTLIALGVIAFICAMAAKGWDFSELGAGKFETREYEVSEDFRSISIDSDTEDITFAASEDGRCRVVFFESEKERHSAEVRGNEQTAGNGMITLRCFRSNPQRSRSICPEANMLPFASPRAPATSRCPGISPLTA